MQPRLERGHPIQNSFSILAAYTLHANTGMVTFSSILRCIFSSLLDWILVVFPRCYDRLSNRHNLREEEGVLKLSIVVWKKWQLEWLNQQWDCSHLGGSGNQWQVLRTFKGSPPQAYAATVSRIPQPPKTVPPARHRMLKHSHLWVTFHIQTMANCKWSFHRWLSESQPGIIRPAINCWTILFQKIPD